MIGEFNKIISDVVKNDPAPFIYERIGERYHHILIDEFQDTDITKVELIIDLVKNNSNLYCVVAGDILQTIFVDSFKASDFLFR